MDTKTKTILIEKINKSSWWHVIPRDSDAYRKRGKFYASTYKQAEFYGRPNNIPEKVFIKNPVCGFSEGDILKQLFPKAYKALGFGVVNIDDEGWYAKRVALDAKMFQRALKMSYDAIVLLGSSSTKSLAKNRKPSSMELNVLKPI